VLICLKEVLMSFVISKDIPAVELARQLTLLDFQLLTKVRPSELLNNRFTREETSPNIAALAKRFQKVILTFC
jgi:hypothetical protein